MSGLIAQILVAQVLAPGLFGAELYDRGQLMPLDPEEARCVVGAAEKRRRDFALGRACAHAALAQLGQDGGPIAKADNGAPLWPAAIVGSITHTEGYAAALVAHATEFAGLGVDAERIGGVTQDLWRRVFDAREQNDLARLSDAGETATILFSAKEACHKAGRERVLRFHELHVVLAENCFTARRGAEVFEGRYAAAEGLVLTAAWTGQRLPDSSTV